MTEAILALTYDPTVWTVLSSDITLGSIPGLGEGWQLKSVVDQAAGQIGIELYSTTAITTARAGSLVNIAFHLRIDTWRDVRPPKASAPSVRLVSMVTPNGQEFSTQVDDAQGALVLSRGMNRVTVDKYFALMRPKQNSQ